MTAVPPPPPASANPLPAPGARPLRVGLVADTHGLLRPEVKALLRGSDFIIHAGDICAPTILEELAELAPVTAVRGNCDQGPWAERLPWTAGLRLGGVLIHVVHDLGQLDLDPGARGIRVVVSGHSHRPSAQERGGVLFVNPGSCGPRRFSLPVAWGELLVAGDQVYARTSELAMPRAGAGRGPGER